MGSYQDAYQRSLADPEAFWLAAAESIDWSSPPTTALDDNTAPLYRWFPDGELNTCHNALDRHVDAGRGDQAALVYDSPVTGTKASYTYRELRDEVATFAGALRSLGVGRGDRVIIYMPMVPRAVVAMLACARLGAVHSVVFGGFAPKELASRIEDATPKVIVAASCGIEPTRIVEYKPIIDAALAATTHQPDRVVVLQREQAPATLGERDVDWDTLVADASPAECVRVKATDPLYILYTSGTTGRPKGVVRDNGGHAVALYWSMPNIYDIHPGDVWWTASDVGWVVGHSYIVYAPLLVGATTVLYEGKPVGTPDAGAFWRVIAEHRVKALFTAPTAFRAIKRMDPNAAEVAKYDLSEFRTLFLAGERLDPETYHWASEHLGVPVADHWWQTETGWPVLDLCPLHYTSCRSAQEIGWPLSTCDFRTSERRTATPSPSGRPRCGSSPRRSAAGCCGWSSRTTSTRPASRSRPQRSSGARSSCPTVRRCGASSDLGGLRYSPTSPVVGPTG
jgi:propionyl-CoA synthetase